MRATGAIADRMLSVVAPKTEAAAANTIWVFCYCSRPTRTTDCFGYGKPFNGTSFGPRQIHTACSGRAA